MVYYVAGSPWHAGTNLHRNVTGECPHHHRTPDAAQKCIDALDRAIKRGHGRNAYADRVVMEVHADGGRQIYDDSPRSS